ncbi:MAG: hypothetical protein ABJM39_09630 [Porticoccus sp.]|uniref:hypothetical protein n=1 Tax=Porticoccus sp. TaxID=2024853 RepID=UPI00329937CC
MTQSASISLSVAVSQSVAGDVNTAKNSIAVNSLLQLLNGTGADQANQAFSDERTLAASTSESLDLAGSLTDAFGASITFTKIKAMLVIADEGNGDNIEVGGAASNGFASFLGDASDVVLVPPGGLFLLTAPDADGFAVTASTGDLLKINNADSGAAGTYTIVLIGTE